MAEPNLSLHIDGKNPLFGPATDIVHVQGHQRDEAVIEEPTGNEIPESFGSASRVINQTTPRIQNLSHGVGPSAPAQPNISALLGLPDGETLTSWYTKQQATLNLVYAQLSTQQALIQAQALPSTFLTPSQRQTRTQTPQ
ncbi:hypothetical protein Hanom_Chr00s012713g01749861 [Helianthus anomalus]